jgi:hypothetical protein
VRRDAPTLPLLPRVIAELFGWVKFREYIMSARIAASPPLELHRHTASLAHHIPKNIADIVERGVTRASMAGARVGHRPRN